MACDANEDRISNGSTKRKSLVGGSPYETLGKSRGPKVVVSSLVLPYKTLVPSLTEIIKLSMILKTHVGPENGNSARNERN